MYNLKFLSAASAAVAVLLVQLAATKPVTNQPAKLFDFKLTPDMKDADFDQETSALSKLIKYVVKGKGSRSEYLSLLKSDSSVEIGISIRDDSLFVPGDVAANIQKGFRRTDMLPAINPSTAFNGTTTFYQSIRSDPKSPLNFTHFYLLASVEVPSGDHVFDVVVGTDFDPQNTAPKITATSKMIRVRNFATKTLYQVPFTDGDTFNFAVTVDWNANMLTVYASTNNTPLKKVGPATANDAKMANAGDRTKFEFHSQVVKHPVPNPADSIENRKNTPHFGLQPPIKTPERVYFSNIFLTSGSEVITEVAGPKGGKQGTPGCKPKGRGTTNANVNELTDLKVGSDGKVGGITLTNSKENQDPNHTKRA